MITNLFKKILSTAATSLITDLFTKIVPPTTTALILSFISKYHLKTDCFSANLISLYNLNNNHSSVNLKGSPLQFPLLLLPRKPIFSHKKGHTLRPLLKHIYVSVFLHLYDKYLKLSLLVCKSFQIHKRRNMLKSELETCFFYTYLRIKHFHKAL